MICRFNNLKCEFINGSIKNDKRPAYQEMMREVKNKAINVIVAF